MDWWLGRRYPHLVTHSIQSISLLNVGISIFSPSLSTLSLRFFIPYFITTTATITTWVFYGLVFFLGLGMVFIYLSLVCYIKFAVWVLASGFFVGFPFYDNAMADNAASCSVGLNIATWPLLSFLASYTFVAGYTLLLTMPLYDDRINGAAA